MLNISKSYAKVWEVEDKGKYLSGKIGSSRKNKATDEWINSTFFCRFVGHAVELARTLVKGDKIIITNATIESTYDKEKQKGFTNVAIFNFEMNEGQGTSPKQADTYQQEDDTDELPF